MGVDPKLLAIATAAEAGQACPLLRLVSGPMFVHGTPVRSSVFGEEASTAIRNELWNQAQRFRRKEREAAYQQVLGGVQPSIEAASRAPEPPNPVTLTMLQATLWAWGESSGQRVPVVRIALDSISAWWVGEGTELKGDTGGGVGWFYGVSFPLGN